MGGFWGPKIDENGRKYEITIKNIYNWHPFMKYIYAEIGKNIPFLNLNISNTRRARAKLKTFLVDKNAQNLP